MTPDFLEFSWEQPAVCLDASMPEGVVLDVQLPDVLLAVLLDQINQGDPPDLVMVWDGWLEELDQDGHIEHLSVDDAYFPVAVDNEILGVRVPWAHQWTAIIPTSSSQQDLTLDLLKHSCIWEREVNELEEYQAFGALLAEEGYDLIWADRSVIDKELGGIPVEITVVPTTVQNDEFFQLIIARDQKGKVTARTELLPAVGRKYGFPDIGSGMLKATYDAFVFSDEATVAMAAEGRPDYCSRPKHCDLLDPLKPCPNWWECPLAWLFGDAAGVSSDDLDKLGMTGKATTTVAFNPAYPTGSWIRALKVRGAMETHDNYQQGHKLKHSAAQVRNDTNVVNGFSVVNAWVNGFTQTGAHTLTIIPAGHKSYSGTPAGPGSMVTLDRVAILMNNLINLAPYDDTYYVNAYGPGDVVATPLYPSIFDGMDNVPINWQMDYDEDEQVLTVSYDVEAKGCYGVYGLCEVCLKGASEGESRFRMDETDVHVHFNAAAIFQASCFECPCMHADTGGGIELFMDIVFPDPCKCDVLTSIRIGWGGHGDALNIKREACDTIKVDFPPTSYNFCADPKVQAELSALSQDHPFLQNYGTEVGGVLVADYLAIQTAAEDYKRPATTGSRSSDSTCDDPAGDILGRGGISVPHHQMEIPMSARVVVPSNVSLGDPCSFAVDMGWVEDLAGAYYRISYDPDVMTLTGVSGGQIGNVEIPVSWWSEPIPGLVEIEHYSIPGAMGVTGSGSLSRVHFLATGTGQTLIEFVDGHLYDPQFGEITVDWNRGSTTGRRRVQIEIRPGSEANSINPRAQGVVPVAVITTDDFDAATVDPDTVSFAGVLASESSLEEDIDGDGDLDMLLDFVIRDLHLPMDRTEAFLAGETLDGVKIMGSDSVQITLEMAPILPSDPVHQARKNRYISIDPTTNEETEVAIEVTLSSMKRCSGDNRRACKVDADCPGVCQNHQDYQCSTTQDCANMGVGGICIPTHPCTEHPDVGSVTKWIDVPFESPCFPQYDCAGQWFANLVDNAVYRVWTEGTLHITDCEIVPVAMYELRTTADEIIFSEPLVIGTIEKPHVHYGDCVGSGPGFTPPDGYTNVVDVLAYLVAFRAMPWNGHTTWVDLHGDATEICESSVPCNIPQGILNVSDLSRIKWGFMGMTYAETPGQVNPGDCPS